MNTELIYFGRCVDNHEIRLEKRSYGKCPYVVKKSFDLYGREIENKRYVELATVDNLIDARNIYELALQQKPYL